jgi:4-hydroxybenzoate polyprenyltransferase
VTSWAAGFDILYSLQDLEFDRSSGLHSIPVKIGKGRALALAVFLHVLSLLAWLGVGILAGLGWIYQAGLGGCAFFLFREHWLIQRFGLAKIQQAFFTMNVGVSLALLTAAVAALYLR